MKYTDSFFQKIFCAAAAFLLAAVLLPLSLRAQSQDPWAGIAADLPDTLSWIQRTTVTSADGSSYVRDITFYDGLGYPSQEVLIGASPGGLASIYTPIVYDPMRRADVRSYLPYAVTTPTGVFDNGAFMNASQFYLDSYQDTLYYAEKTYETSPVGRPLSLLREGKEWYGNGGSDSHRSTFSYRTNTAGDAVPKYVIIPGTGKASYKGPWPAGTLHCTETEDEEGSVSRTWTDAFGKTILSEMETGQTLPGGGREKARTLYIYDLRDSLVLVVQPEGMKALSARPVSSRHLSLTPGSSTDNGDITDKYCFVWTYDGRGNVLSEHTPGGGTTQYAYDARNRRVLQTDSLMCPTSGAGGKMILTLHDQYDRIVEERYVSSPQASFETLRSNLRNIVSHTLSPSYITGYLPTSQVLRTAEYFPFSTPTSTLVYPLYGDGAFTPDPGVAENDDLEDKRIEGFLKKETIHPAPDFDGNVPAGAPSVTRYYHYDYKGRVIQTSERWSDGRLHRISTRYSFTGDVLATKETVVIPAGGGGTDQVNSLATFYTRDPRGRVLTCSRVLDGTDTLSTVHYAYDDLGRLVGKTVGNTSNPILETDIGYDLHGWTTAIDVAVTDGVGSGMDTVFSETLRYADAVKNTAAGRYDGNIAETAFTHRIVPSSGGSPYQQTNTWSYDYDGLKRLTDANHYAGAALTPSLTDTERDIAYDLNGNITALKRYGSTGIENDLSFTHTGNRMKALADANATGPDAGTKSFDYDANGNMTTDGRKGLELRWNVLNLVDSAGMHGSSLKYAWLSDGTKVSARADDGQGNGVQKRYLGSFVYTSSGGSSADVPTEVESVAWDEGRIFFNVPAVVEEVVIDPEGGSGGDPDPVGIVDPVAEDTLAWVSRYRDCWFAGDHLGNVRSVIDIMPDLVVPEVLEQNDYLPYGTRIQDQYFTSAVADNRWRYAGKEEQDFTPFSTLNISLLDFGARMYDPYIARWTTIDRLGKRHVGYSTFVYCGSNPLNLFDPDGNDWKDYLKGLAVGFATNLFPGPSSRRDISGLVDMEDYNAGLKTADVTSGAISAGMIIGGELGMGSGETLVVDGVAVAATGVGAPEGALSMASGTLVIAGSTLLKAAGATIATSTASNAASGYNHGETSSSNKSKATKTNSTTLWQEKGKGGGRIDVEVPVTRKGQIQYQEGHGKNKKTYIFKDGKFYGKNSQTGQYDVTAPRRVNDLLSRPDVESAIERGQRYLGQY